MESYDEDLNENPFFHMLQTEHTELFQKAIVEGWIICVPCEGSVPKYSLTVEDFFSHILIPSDELPESHFRTLNDRDVRICNRVVTVEENDISRPVTTHILFEETYYTDDLLKYKVLCLEHPLERHSDFGPVSSNSSVVVNIQTLRDCIDLLWTESRGRDVLEKIDQLIRDFLSSNNNLEFEPLQVQKDLVGSLYTICLQNALRDSRLRERTSTNKHLLENVKLAVETYMLHTVYKKVIKGVTACTAHDDANLNKIIRNLSDIQLRDLGVRQDLYDTVPWAKQELARIDGYSTVLGKVGCLKRMLGAITKQHNGKNSPDLFVGNVIAADDLLPMIVFLVIKTGLPNWIAHLTFMKQFHFSNPSKCQVDEYSFLITSLEAAIEHIHSGFFLGSSVPEAQVVYEETFDKYKNAEEEQHKPPAEPGGIEYLFEQIRLGNEAEVKGILDRSIGSNCMRERESSPTKKNDIILKLCHPLCSCDKCESIISKSLCNTTPTINSCDDRGFTALHVACMFGRPTMVDLLLKYGSNVNACDYSGSTPLHYAAAKGYQNALLLLAHAGAHIDMADNEGNTPLHLACNNGHEGCVKAIIYFAEHVGLKLNVNCANSQGNTALHNASRWGYEGIVHLLLEYGARPGAENKRHMTPLDYAHNIHITRLLMRAIKTMPPSSLMPGCSNSVETNTTSKSKELQVAASSKKTLDFSDNLKPREVSGASSQKGSKTKKVFYGILPETTQGMRNVEKLLKAVSAGDTRLACYYMGLDANDDAVSLKAEQTEQQHEKCHPLCTCEKCQPENDGNSDENCTEEQPHHLLDVNVCDGEGFTPLHVAAMHGRLDLTRLLIDAGAIVDVRTRTKATTPLHFACQNQRLQIVQLLLRRSADPDIQDWHGNTALHYACYVGNIRLVETLLQLASPRLDLKNASGKSAVQEAEEKMALTIVKLLRGGKQLAVNGEGKQLAVNGE